MELMTTFALQTRLFKEPDIAAEQIATISPNTTVELLDACNQFCRVALTDESGHRFEGYVVRNFLKPLVSAPAPTVVDNSPEPTGKKEGWLTNRPKLDQKTTWLVGGLVLVLLVNVFSTVLLWKQINSLPRYTTVSAFCSGISSSVLASLKCETKPVESSDPAGFLLLLHFCLRKNHPVCYTVLVQ